MKNKFGYSKIQLAFIRMWGAILYLDYDYLQPGSDDETAIAPYVDGYLLAIQNGDEESIEEFNEWFQEGAQTLDNVPLLTKDLFDKVMHSAEREITEDLVVYKHGNGKVPKDRWISTSLKKECAIGYLRAGEDAMITEIKLKAGTKVIFADGIADNYEVIINTNQLT